MNKIVYKFIIILSIIGLVLPTIVFAQEINQPPKMPETFDEVSSFFKKVIEFFPNALKSAWQETVKIWRRITDLFKNFWDFTIWPKIEGAWQKILSIFGKKVEEQKEKASQELEKEKQEMEEEAKEAGKNLWQKFIDLIKEKL